MRPWLAPLLLLACSDPAPVDPLPSPGPQQAGPLTSFADPEDVYCGTTCEPGSSRPCGEGVEVCDPTGLGWGACGYGGYETSPSSCAKGTRCTRRSSGGNMGCRAICAAVEGAGCEDSLELVRCKAPTPGRAERAGCLPGPEELAYCCPPESAILNPLLGGQERKEGVPGHEVPAQLDKPDGRVLLPLGGLLGAHLAGSSPRQHARPR
jgi:hypothetical protein